MKAPDYFHLPYDFKRKAQQERLDDLRVKYILDDGSYIIMYYDPRHPDWVEKCIKYEKDGCQKEYDYQLDLRKIIGADGTVLAEFKYETYPGSHSRNRYVVSDTLNKRKYHAHGKYVDSYFVTECYICVEREFENGCKRAKVDVAIEDLAPVFFPKPEPGSFVQPKPESKYIKEVYPDGTERFYKNENFEMSDKFMESDWDEAKQYRQMFPLIYEKLPNGTQRVYKNGYIEKENIPNLVTRFWRNGVLEHEIFDRFDILEFVYYDDENVTSETRKDGTVCTFYQGKLVSENRPNYSHNTVTSRIDNDGVVRAFFPNGQPMFVYDGGIYQQWDKNGRVKQKCGCVKSAGKGNNQKLEHTNSPLTCYYETRTDENKLLAAEGWGFVFVGGKFEDLKKDFYASIAKQDMKQAVKDLKWICLSADNIFGMSRQDYRPYDGISMMARNCLDSTQIKVLENGLIAFGAIFEDRYFVRSSFVGGIEWYWRAAGILFDLENGCVVAKCATDRIKVRDKYDPNKDKWKHIDTHDFIDVKDGKLTVRLGSSDVIYESASCDIDMEKYNQFLQTIKAESQIKQTTQQINDYINKENSIGR